VFRRRQSAERRSGAAGYLGGLSPFVQQLSGLDASVLAGVETLRWEPLTVLFLIASAWWVKWPLIAFVGGLGDASRRRRLPAGALAAGASAAVAGLSVLLLKGLFDRPRPPVAHQGLDPVGIVPVSASFPSGHAATAFATAVAVGIVYPRLRVPLLALATLVAVSRVYLGVHYGSDVLAGSALGVAIGLATGLLVRRMQRASAHEPGQPAYE
jgi:undecaprenyl-diphosphatase